MRGLKLSHALASLALGAALAAVATPAVRADDDRGRNRCQQQTERAQQKYQEEAGEHGRHSRQAENARARLNSVWDRCYNEVHTWYDPHSQQCEITAIGTGIMTGTVTVTVIVTVTTTTTN